MNMENAGVIAAQERAHIAALLIRYPDLATGELEEIHNWFNRVASPLDLGLLASDPQVAPKYRTYRAEHHDRFRVRHLVQAGLFIAAVGMFVAAIVITMP